MQNNEQEVRKKKIDGRTRNRDKRVRSAPAGHLHDRIDGQTHKDFIFYS